MKTTYHDDQRTVERRLQEGSKAAAREENNKIYIHKKKSITGKVEAYRGRDESTISNTVNRLILTPTAVVAADITR